MKCKCPLRFSSDFPYPEDKECIEDLCQFWTSAFTTENIEIFDCALVIGARKNAEGKIPV
jgi:hypothetical protein